MRTRIANVSIRKKVTFLVFLTIIFILVADILIYAKVNNAIHKINEVYASNVDVNELSENIADTQNYMYEYLSTRSTDSLSNFYRSEQEYEDIIETLNNENTDNDVLMLEKDIRNMSKNYLALTENTVTEKRGRNIEKYKTYYEESIELYQYINNDISTLNNMRFKQNTAQYNILLKALGRIEVSCTIGLLMCTAFCINIIYVLTGKLMEPLVRLAATADEVAAGNLDVKLTKPNRTDEIGSVTLAFNSMIFNIRKYIAQIRENMKKEKEMQERELLMETHLKDAQLKYLQAQINPHFLFNSLNAGAQLAVMEDAEKTCIFIEKMADFFRYNIKKMEEKTTLLEEVITVDNYIYIMNVRYAGDIHYEQAVDEKILDAKVPSMILQPIVENALNYGIRDIEYEGKIFLKIEKKEDNIQISVEDNGHGMTKERIKEVLEGKAKESINSSDSTGVGLDNVKNRLELYYKRSNLLQIESAGLGIGTRVIITVPAMDRED